MMYKLKKNYFSNKTKLTTIVYIHTYIDYIK